MSTRITVITLSCNVDSISKQQFRVQITDEYVPGKLLMKDEPSEEMEYGLKIYTISNSPKFLI